MTGAATGGRRGALDLEIFYFLLDRRREAHPYDVPGVMEDLDDPATLHRELVQTTAAIEEGAAGESRFCRGFY